MRPCLMLAAGLMLLTPALAAEAQTAPRAARSAVSTAVPEYQADQALAAAIASPSRPAADRARDAFRHPEETLTFWGLTPGLTVVEVQPGSAGWWTAILQPYAQATGGRYVPANDLAALQAIEPGSADMVLIARAFHNWARQPGVTDTVLAAAFRALKPGGVLAVEQHRAVEGLNVADTAPTGYVPESHVIHAAQGAGFVLDGRSDINANAADDRDHPFGVWTLPPVRRSSQGERTLTPAERAAFDAIGESDRMTLRLRKPA
ncbi:MAG TPA: methyltransferase [Brevundimonas sp.]|uniref:class I SAM-dependent methyltransferase n=1 Tax=Brevundimonas sp. TaxID=1871086 RepID=UPI002626AF6C|nr:methyltransferase [Brevundimonas sp.]HRO32514.1 methyltransferase [Brevundimonas sp.]